MEKQKSITLEQDKKDKSITLEQDKEFKCKKCGYESDEPIDFMKAEHFLSQEGFICNDCAENKKSNLREKLADLEHEQWRHWTIYFLRNLKQENFDRWARQSKTTYSELPEIEKQSDREWADKVLILFEEWKKEFIRLLKEELNEGEITYGVKWIHKKIDTLSEDY